MTKLDEVIRILAAETGDYVNSDNVDDILQSMIDRKNSDLDDLNEDFQFIISGKCEPDDPKWEKWIAPNLFISWAYLQEIMRLGGVHEDKIALADSVDDIDPVDDIFGNPYEDQASEILDVPLSDYRENYAGDARKALRRLKKIVGQINSSSNDN